MVRDGDRLRPEACQSPIWDTALAMLALRAAGIPADDPQLQAAGSWLLGEEVTVRGRLGDPPSGSRAGRLVVRVRQRPLSGRRRHRRGRACAPRARTWATTPRGAGSTGWSECNPGAAAGARSTPTTRRSGSTSSRSATSARSPTSRVPTSPRTLSRRSAHETGYGASASRPGSSGSSPSRRPDGSWFGRWGVNHVYGTGAAVPALEACGLPPEHPAIRRALCLARLRPATERCLRRGHRSPTASPRPVRPRRRDAFPNGLGATRLRRGRSRDGLVHAACSQVSLRDSAFGWRLGRAATSRALVFPLDFMIRYHLYRLDVPAPRARAPERKAQRMKFPLRSTVQIGKYVASQQRKGERYPLVLMLEPTLACNIACIGCGKIREYESNKARLTVEECIDAGAQCPAPVVSICGGEPLVYKGIEDVVAGMLELGKNIDLCTNALRLEQYLDVFEPSHQHDLRRPSRRDARDPRLHLRLPGSVGRRRRRDQEGARSRLPRHDEHDDLQGDVDRGRASR